MSNLVALSTGHSRMDSGAISVIDGTIEYDVNCKIVEYMERGGLYNGEFELVDIPLEDQPYPTHLVNTVKAINAKKHEFACCVEVHHNSSINPKIYGAQAIYWDTSEQGRLLALSIAESMATIRAFYAAPFKKFWKDKQREYYQPGAISTLRHLKRRLYYLAKTLIPAVIIEVGYLSSEIDLNMIHNCQPESTVAINYGIELWLERWNDA